jgi:aminoglycoside 2'-N-acetyltransferase I
VQVPPHPSGPNGRGSLDVRSAEALDPTARREIIQLCELAYREDFSRWFQELLGSTHILARNQAGALVSHAAWVPRWLHPEGHPHLRTAYLEAVATHPAYQRQGLATAVLRQVTDLLIPEPSWQLAALSPTLPEFYARLGWELWRGPLGIRHGDRIEASPSDEQVMIFRLPGTPASLDSTSLLTAEWRAGELW